MHCLLRLRVRRPSGLFLRAVRALAALPVHVSAAVCLRCVSLHHPLRSRRRRTVTASVKLAEASGAGVMWVCQWLQAQAQALKRAVQLCDSGCPRGRGFLVRCLEFHPVVALEALAAAEHVQLSQRRHRRRHVRVTITVTAAQRWLFLVMLTRRLAPCRRWLEEAAQRLQLPASLAGSHKLRLRRATGRQRLRLPLWVVHW